MLPCFPRLAALVLLSLPAAAQSTVQLMLEGVTDPGGTTIDVEFAVRGPDGTEPQIVALHMALLPNTTALDVAALLAARLAEAKIRHVAAPAVGGRSTTSLFVQGVSRVLVRASDGLHATIGLPECAPTSVLLLPPLTRRGKGALDFHAVTSDARLRQRGAIDFSVAFEADTTPTLAVESLSNACARANWLSERPTHETWRPSASFEGLDIVGTSFNVDTHSADWGIELRLP